MKFNNSTSLSLALCIAILSGCTQPGETTGIGAAAGGALGAGLGAIIGSQTGAAGSGLAIGAVAGAAGGALVGNAFQSQQEAIRSQDEAIERQERMVRAQRSEIEELRRLNQDTPSRKPSSSVTSAKNSRSSVPSQQTTRRLPPPPTKSREEISTSDLAKPALTEPTLTKPTLSERTLTEEPTQLRREVLQAQEEESPRAKLRAPAVDKNGLTERDLTDPAARDIPIVTEPATLGEYEDNRRDSTVGKALPSPKVTSSSCKQAEDELEQSTNSNDSSEKLYHLRRALRLCPDNAVFHHELGKVYLTLKRPADAQYEFKQSLSIDPSYKPALRSISELQKSSGDDRF